MVEKLKDSENDEGVNERMKKNKEVSLIIEDMVGSWDNEQRINQMEYGIQTTGSSAQVY